MIRNASPCRARLSGSLPTASRAIALKASACSSLATKQAQPRARQSSGSWAKRSPPTARPTRCSARCSASPGPARPRTGRSLGMFVDSHCHINFPELAARMPAVLEAMQRERVTHALCIGVNLPELPSVLRLAEAHANVYASVGVHPDYEDTPEPSVEMLVELSRKPKVVAVGETGLDYYRLSGDLEWQRSRFRTHIRAARQCGKPLVIHSRAAADDTVAIMREERAGD